MIRLSCSSTIDLTGIADRKVFKALAALTRACLSLEHGFRATKGMTDGRLKKWPLAIRFCSKINRQSFMSTLEGVAEKLGSGIEVKKTVPKSRNPKPVRFIR